MSGELDFGAISDEFAAKWAPAMRRRIGVAAFNPRTWRGIKGAARHVGVQRLKALAGRVRGARMTGRRQ